MTGETDEKAVELFSATTRDLSRLWWGTHLTNRIDGGLGLTRNQDLMDHVAFGFKASKLIVDWNRRGGGQWFGRRTSRANGTKSNVVTVMGTALLAMHHLMDICQRF